MQWNDEGLVLSARPHGETSAVVTLLTRTRGRHAGLVRGARGRRAQGIYQPGNRLAATWRARLAEHLGTYTCELIQNHVARLFDQPGRLAALCSAAAICDLALPEREPHPACYDGMLALLGGLDGEHWAETYVRWELALLAELGFGIDLSRCAAGGMPDDLAYVSPRTGQAVSRAAAAPYRDRLLPLPSFLVGRSGGGAAEVGLGLRLTGYFLERHVLQPQDRRLPAARQRLAKRFSAA